MDIQVQKDEHKAVLALAGKLDAGILMTVAEIDACLGGLHEIQRRLCKIKRGDLKGHVLTEQIEIEMTALGLKEAA